MLKAHRIRIDSVWIIEQSKYLVGGTDLGHFNLVPMLNRVGIVPPDFATTERVVAPIYIRWMRCRRAEEECVVLCVLRK